MVPYWDFNHVVLDYHLLTHPAGSTPAIPTNQPIKKMKNTNYHQEEVTFTIGQAVTHIGDDGAMFAATITGFSDGLIDLAFSDGDSGSELQTTCF